MNKLLTKVGTTIIKANTIRRELYFKKLDERREENTDVLYDKMKDVASRNP
jgi:hypothetical protein